MNEEELQRLTGFSLEEAVSVRLWDITEQCQKLASRGDTQTAEFLRKEGLKLSQAYEQKHDFLVILHQAPHT